MGCVNGGKLINEEMYFFHVELGHYRETSTAPIRSRTHDLPITSSNTLSLSQMKILEASRAINLGFTARTGLTYCTRNLMFSERNAVEVSERLSKREELTW